MIVKKIHFVIDKNTKTKNLKKIFLKIYGNHSPLKSDVIIVVGGDGFMLEALKKGDRIVTIGGIHGTVSGFKGKEKKMLALKLDKNTNITINRSAVSGLLNEIDQDEAQPLEEQS